MLGCHAQDGLFPNFFILYLTGFRNLWSLKFSPCVHIIMLMKEKPDYKASQNWNTPIKWPRINVINSIYTYVLVFFLVYIHIHVLAFLLVHVYIHVLVFLFVHVYIHVPGFLFIGYIHLSIHLPLRCSLSRLGFNSSIVSKFLAWFLKNSSSVQGKTFTYQSSENNTCIHVFHSFHNFSNNQLDWAQIVGFYQFYITITNIELE